MATLIVTGGSRGIGAATAKLAAQNGWSVFLSYRSGKTEADAVVADIQNNGGTAAALRADCAVEADILALFDHAEAAFGPIKGLVNNAGITGGKALVADVTADTLRAVFDANVIGTILAAREAVKRMTAGGAIVNVSSAAARLGGAGEWVHYAATKGAVDSFTLGLAREIAAAGIRVNAVAPGLIDTDIHATAGDPGRVARMAPQIPMARAAQAREVAEAIIWLLSDAASYITGAVLPVSGGR